MQLVRMVREDAEPRTADVHPAEVENYRAAGFVEAETPAPAPKPARKRKAD